MKHITIQVVDPTILIEVKMKVHLREAKPDTKGRIALYLEYYYGYTESANGKIKPQRKRKNTGIYLVHKPKSKLDREMNKELRIKAEALKSRTELAIINGTFQFEAKAEDGNFVEYFKKFVAKKKAEGASTYYQYQSVQIHFTEFNTNQQLSFSQITQSLCEEFKNHLLQHVVSRTGKALASKSINSYLTLFSSVLESAVKEGMLKANPFKQVRKPKLQQTEREHLTEEEVKLLFTTPCNNEVTKRAFLFACFTGLRFSDVRKLTWGEVKEVDGGLSLVFRQKKTKGLQYLPLTQQAVELLGAKREGREKVFCGLQGNGHVNEHLKHWVAEAGIKKHITFHVARHTHALLLLSKNVSLYTVSKILGHSDIKTTQIYAHILDQNVREAIGSLGRIAV
jgi:integrase